MYHWDPAELASGKASERLRGLPAAARPPMRAPGAYAACCCDYNALREQLVTRVRAVITTLYRRPLALREQARGVDHMQRVAVITSVITGNVCM